MASEFLKSPPHSWQINSEPSWNWLILSEVAEVACPFLVTELLWSSRLVFSSWGTEKLSVLVCASISWVMVRITSLFAIDLELELGDGFCECLLLPQMMSLRIMISSEYTKLLAFYSSALPLVSNDSSEKPLNLSAAAV
ncbi:hypothetical protein SDJN03_04360, partial [Cucurbita argyrosperma subsp. sororia]